MPPRTLLSLSLIVLPLFAACARPGDKDTGTDAPIEDSDTSIDAPIEVTPSIAFVDVFQPVDLTPDGRIALLQQYDATGDFYFYDTETKSLDLMGQVGDASVAAVTGLSADGTVTGFYQTDAIQAGIWTAASGWATLGNSTFPAGCDADVSSGWDITADGSTVVGMLWDTCSVAAGRWDTASGDDVVLERLGVGIDPRAPGDNRATAVADDGSLIGGWASTALAGRYPALWRADGSGFLLEGLPAEQFGEVMAVSPDGTMAAGYSGEAAFYWTEASGAVSIGKLPSETDFAPAIGNAIAGENQLIFGVSGQPFFGSPQAFVWTEAEGMRPLVDVVQQAGLSLPEGYVLTNVLAASVDGTVALGQAQDADFKIWSFVLVLPRSAYGSP